MGTALMMEGLLSACYHVCPNYTNFQFGEATNLLTLSTLKSDVLQRFPSPVCTLGFFFRYFFHVHDRRAVYVEAVSEETPGHQRQRLHRLRLPGLGHLLLRAGSGAFLLWSPVASGF